jgi:hypothetical protein
MKRVPPNNTFPYELILPFEVDEVIDKYEYQGCPHILETETYNTDLSNIY